MVQSVLKKREKKQDDKHVANERKNELLPRKIAPNTDAWKDANTFGYEFENDIKRPIATCLTNTQIHRINLIPRSYD